MATAVKRKVIVDTDAGTDDAMALVVILADSTVDVLAITTVFGNVDADQVATNVLRILEVSGRLDVPVYCGAATSLMGQCPDAQHYHGEDGLGDVPCTDLPSRTMLQSKSAVQALVDLVTANPGEITLIFLGPLTNLATVLRCDSDFGSHVRDCFVMGGNYRGRGNITIAAEFNFFADPEAAHIVLSTYGSIITLIPWELCVDHEISWDFFDKITLSPAKKSQFCYEITKNVVRQFYKDRKDGGFLVADQFVAAVFLKPHVVKRAECVHGVVERFGEFTRGQLIIDWAHQLKKPPNIKIVTEIHMPIFEDLLCEGLLG